MFIVKTLQILLPIVLVFFAGCSYKVQAPTQATPQPIVDSEIIVVVIPGLPPLPDTCECGSACLCGIVEQAHCDCTNCECGCEASPSDTPLPDCEPNADGTRDLPFKPIKVAS